MTQITARRTFLRQCATGAALISLASISGSALFAARQSSFKLTDAEWRKRLSPRAYAVLRQGDTERPGSSPLNKEHRRGTFSCAGCALPLFASRTKFESGTGWPSFYDHCQMPSPPARIAAWACAGPKCAVRAALGISAMSFPMDPIRPVFVIA